MIAEESNETRPQSALVIGTKTHDYFVKYNVSVIYDASMKQTSLEEVSFFSHKKENLRYLTITKYCIKFLEKININLYKPFLFHLYSSIYIYQHQIHDISYQGFYRVGFGRIL